MRWMRVSSRASTPRSVFVRIRRPKPCFSDNTASGTWYSAKALRPSSCKARTRAATIGSLGTANGSRSTITQESFWQGVDVPGEQLSCAIVDRLPFAVPSDPIVAARVRALQEDGRNPFAEFQVPQAVLALKQGFGRLIRTKTDRGVLALL